MPRVTPAILVTIQFPTTKLLIQPPAIRAIAHLDVREPFRDDRDDRGIESNASTCATWKDVHQNTLALAFAPDKRRRGINSPTMVTTNQDCDVTSSLRTCDISQDRVMRPFELVLNAYTSLASRSLLLRSKMESSIQSNRAGVSDGLNWR